MPKKPPEATVDAKPLAVAWPKPLYSRTQVNAAGDALIGRSSAPDEVLRARGVVNNWRAAHSLPLDSVRKDLQERVAEYGEGALVAQRLKRLSSIDAKLRRFGGMKLARMQDVGGCRAVLHQDSAGRVPELLCRHAGLRGSTQARHRVTSQRGWPTVGSCAPAVLL